jgi:hypothetical protein
MAANGDDNKAFDVFELLTAVLLGLAAIGAALSGLQGGQWGGRQLEAFSEANKMTTKAATQYNEDTVLVNADYAAVAAAKQHILEARDAPDPQTRERHFEIASYLYTTQLTEKAYKAMSLPMDSYVEDEPEAEEHAATPSPPATPAAAEASESEAEDEEEPSAAVDPAKPKLEKDIPNEAILASLSQELDEAYVDQMLEEGGKMFEEADAKFAEGKQANGNGDKFDLVGVFYTVALFFAGVGLVFKTNVRWAFFTLGLLVFAGASVYMARLPWAG